MIETIEKILPVYTTQQLRGMAATLSKNGSTKFAESQDILRTISLIASIAIQDKDSLTKYYPYIQNLFLTAAKVLVGLLGLTAQQLELVDSTLFLISQVSCMCFARDNHLPAGDVLLVISDPKKSLYYQSSSKEDIVVTVTPAGGSVKKDLDIIPEEYSSSLCQTDLMTDTLEKNNQKTMKRENIRQGYVRIAEGIIKELEGCQKQFKDRSPEWVNKYLEIIVKLMKIMSTQYLIQIFKSIRENVWQYYTKADQNIIRNLTKQLLESMFLTVEQIFIRLQIQDDKNKWLQNLIISITLPLIRCQLLKKKIIGTKYLADVCNQVYNARAKYLKDSEMKVWLAHHKVFDELFTLDTHDQIMEAGGDILRYIVRNNSLTNDQLYAMLNIIEKGDANLRRILSKIMYDLTLRYDYNQIEIILVKFKEFPSSIFIEEMIKIISDISRYSIQKHRLFGIDIFQRLIIQYYEHFKPSIQEELLSKYIQLMKCVLERSTSETNCLLYFERLLNIPLDTHIIQLLKKLLDLFPQTRTETKFYQYNNTNYEIVKFLIQQARLHHRLIEIINITGDAKRRQSCLDFLVSIVKVYKENSLEEKYLSVDILEKLTNHSKVFCQLLYSFRSQNFQELFTILVSQSVISMQHFLCLKQLFYYINKTNMMKVLSQNNSDSNTYEVSILPERLNGFPDFMIATLEAEKQSVREQAASFICQMYCNLSPQLSDEKDKIIKQFVEFLLDSIQKLHNGKAEDQKLLGYLCLLEGMMNQTQTKGVGTLIAHSSLVNIESIKITITNQITYGYGIQRNMQSKFPSNLTLFEMLVQVGKVFKCSPQDIIIKYNDCQIKPIYNGLSLHQLSLKDKTLNAHKRVRQSVSKVQMLDLYNKLTEPAIKAFTGIYNRFSTDSKMTMNDAAKFVEASTNDSCSIQDYRVVDLFFKYDTNKDSILDLQDFMSFFEDSCKSRESTVWRNLQSLRIRPDLKRYEDVKENLDYNIMARFIIYESDIYDVLFEMTLDENLKQKAIQLLKRLPTSKKIIKETLQNIKFEDKDEFMSWYKLTLIQWMIHQNADKKQQKSQKKQGTLNEESNRQTPIKAANQSPQKHNQNQFWVHQEEVEMKQIKFARSESAKSKKNYENQNELQVVNQPDIAHIDASTINQWKQRFLSNKMYIKIYEQAEAMAQTPLKSMSSTSKNCLLLCLQIIRRLCKVPQLQKALPATAEQIPEIILIDLPHNRLSETLIPQLFESDMNTQLLQPLLCLLFNNSNIDFLLIYPGLFYYEKQVRVLTTNFLYFYERINNYNIDLFTVDPQEQCEEFFVVVNKILIEDDKINLEELFTKAYTDIESHSIRQEIGSKNPDYLFEGKLNILNNILVILPKIHITPQIQLVLIQKLHRALYPSTRETLYNLLLKTQLTGLFKYLTSFIQLVEPKKPSSIRNHYVGLYNLGCTCYMNAMLQQFYMTPEFRYVILGVENQVVVPISEKKGKKFKDNVLHQLQRMFAFLDMSHRGDYSPQLFCYSYKNDINFGIQEDTQQFLGIVFSKIEHELKNTHFSDLVDKVYGGKTIMTIKCSKCEKKKYRVEDFNNLQLEVKQRKNLDESLSRFSEQETINDFKCEFCHEQGIIRSTSLYQLPNILIVHLMRMVFDVQTYQRIKLHNKLQFPTQLNLHKYMKVQQQQSLPEQFQCQYTLKGVVIHSGCAQSGHYYSLIKDSNEWYKFDDSRVTHFSANDVGDEAFGGREEFNDWGNTGSTRSKNAYMLIYEKKQKSQWVLKKSPTQQERQRMKPFVDIEEILIDTDHVKQDEQKQFRIKKFKKSIRRDLEDQIVNDHKVMFHELQFYQDGFFRFLRNVIEKMTIKKEFFNQILSKQSKAYTQLSNLLTTEQFEQYTQLLLFLLKMMQFFTKVPNPDINIVKTIIPYIDLLLFILPDQAEIFFMNIDTQKYFQVLLTHSDSPIRDLYRSILNRCCNVVLQKKNVDLNDPQDQSVYKVKLISILEGLLGLLYTEVPKNSVKLHQYFQFWRIFCVSTKECMKYCFNKNFISLFIDFLLEKKSPIMLNPGNYSLPKYTNPPIQSLLQMLAALLSRSTSNINQSQQQPQDNLIYILTENDKKCLTHIPFYSMMIQQKQDFTGIIMILSQLVRNNQDFSLEVAVFLMKGINKSERYESALAYMMIINGYLAVDDEFQRKRLEWILGVPQLIESAINEYSIKYSIRNQTVRYLSSLFAGQDSYKSVLQLLYSQRRNPDSFSVTGVSILLNLLTNSKTILQYVLQLPPPCHFFGFYVDWIPHFVDSFQKDRMIILPDDKDKMAEKCFANLIEIHKGMEIMIASAKDREMAEKVMREEEEAERRKWEDDDGTNQFYDKNEYEKKEEKVQEFVEVECEKQQVKQEKQPKDQQLDLQQITLQKNESDGINVPQASDLKKGNTPNQEQDLYTSSSVVIESSSSNKQWYQDTEPILPTAQIPENTTILPSLRPLYIIGCSEKIQAAGTYTVEEGQKQVKLTELILHTYVLESKPTGEDNLALPKELFEHQYNFRIKPLKYFVQSDTKYLTSYGQTGVPQIRPTIIHIKIQTSANILVTSKNPDFRYSFYYTNGIHHLNIPYLHKDIDQLIEISFTNYGTEEESERREEASQNNGQFVGPISQAEYYNGPSAGNWEQSQVACGVCTYVNTRGAMSCQVCSNALDFI